MINLTKPDEIATINLSKGNTDLVVKAQWVDNGDASADNDDLDLRCSILFPNGDMYLVDADYRCGLDSAPFARHHGDVKNASKDMPGEEIITVSRHIASKAGGPVALVFSVYSALGNGAVSVASLKPRMMMSCGGDEVVCSFDFSKTSAASNPNIYTYVIGYAIVTEDEIILAPSGKTSRPSDEETAWIAWHGNSVDVEVNGPAVFKGKQAPKGAMYNQQKGITRTFTNVNYKKKGGLLGGLFS